MSSIDIDLQKKINAIGLHLVDDTIYKKHLKPMENIGMNVVRFKYYKLYGQYFMPYSQEYLLGNSTEHLVKRDKENYKQFCPSFFGRLKRRIDGWLLRRELNKMKKNNPPHPKNY